MAIKVSGTEVVSNTRELKNITSVDASTLSVLNSGIGTEATRGTLTKSFTSGETASITLSAAVSPTPVVSATKEISQAGVSSKGAWDVNSTASNYNRLDSAYNTTLTPSSEGWDITQASFNQSLNMSAAPFSSAATGEEAYPTGLYIRSDGLKMYVLGFGEDRINEFNLSTAWDISSASHANSLSIRGSGSGQDDTPEDVFFKPDGTKMYFVGNDGNDVNEYNLSTAWDISTSVYGQNFSVAGEDNQPKSIFFKPDGLKMYVIGGNGRRVHEYNLSTAWDVSTASNTQNFSVYSQESEPNGLFFKPDGTKMYISGYSGDDVNEYNVSTAWDISTASFLQNFSVASQETVPNGIFFKPDGTKMYVVGANGDAVYEYNLSTAWNVSTSVYLQNFSVAAQESYPANIFFKPDGLKMYLIGFNGGGVQEYDTRAEDYITSATWTSATTNSELYALQQALTNISINRMDKAQLQAITDTNHYTLGDSLDLMIGFYLASSNSSVPSSDGVSINYDATALNQGAVLGTDYNYDFPDSTTVRVTSSAAQNLKVRVV